MSEKIEDGGPAFPCSAPEGYEPSLGMSLRDWFAGQALAGWLASYGPDSSHPVSNDAAHLVAARSYAMADAMLAARAKEPGA